MLVTHITTHVSDAQSRLLSQYQGATRLVAVLASLTANVQPLEDAIFSLSLGRQLDQAVGAQLDVIGLLVGYARNGSTDAAYRVLLRGVIAQENSDTTLPTIEAVAGLLYQASAVFVHTGTSPAHARVLAPAQITLGIGSPQTAVSLFPTVRAMLTKALAAGVALTAVIQFVSAGAFSMAGPQSWVGGFGDATNPAAGAPFATLIYSNPAQ